MPSRKKRMRRAYLKPWLVTTKPKSAGLNKEGMSNLYDHMRHTEGYRGEIDNGIIRFLDVGKEWKRVKHLMETRARMTEKNLHNLAPNEEFLHVVLQQSKHFKLVLFWITGVPKYHFVKHEDFKGLVSISKPYESRSTAMSAYDHRDIFWLDFVRITAV